MKQQTKNIIWIVVGFFVSFIVATGLYSYFSGGQVVEDPSQPQEEGRFNPFGLFGDDEGDQTQFEVATTTDSQESVPASFNPNLLTQQITTEPVAGARIIARNGVPALQYVNRTDGHISEVNLENGVVRKISNTTVPRVQEVVWGNESTLGYQYLNDLGNVETFVGSIENIGTSTVGTFNGVFLPQNISDIDFNSEGDQLFHLTTQIETGIQGTLTNITNDAPVQNFSSPIREWLLRWGREQTVELATKPSNGVPGQLFLFNVQSRNLNHVLRDMPALTALGSPELSLIAYAGSNDGFTLHIRNTESGVDADALVQTLPEKCVWVTEDKLYCAVPNNMPQNMPDVWYQGRVPLSDTMWWIDAPSGYGEQVIDPETNVDAINLSVSPDERFLSFINKTDGSLWVVTLPETTLQQDDV